METTEVVLLVGLAIAAVVVMSLTFREDHQAILTQRMAASSGLVLTPDQIALVQDKLGLRQRGAVIGGILGVGLSWLLTTGERAGDNNPRIILIAGGALVGIAAGTACVALVVGTRRPADTVLVARSTSVSLTDYIPRPAHVLVGVLVGATIVGVVALLVTADGRAVPPSALALSAAAIATLAVFEIAGRRIVAKGQPIGSVIELVLNDAVRTTYLRDLLVAPAVLASYSLLIAFDTTSEWFDAPLPSELGIAAYSAVLLVLVIVRMTKWSRRVAPHYLRRLWPEIAASGPGSTAIVDEPSR